MLLSISRPIDSNTFLSYAAGNEPQSLRRELKDAQKNARGNQNYSPTLSLAHSND